MNEGREPTMSAPRCAKKPGGNALTEFALVIPFLLTGIFGVIEFGRALYAYHFVSDAAREASRWASVRGNGCTAYSTCRAGQAEVRDYIVSITPPGIDTSSSKLLVDTSWVPPPGGPGDNCAKFPKNPGCAVQVEVTYRFNFILPFMPTSTYSMKSTSEMVISH